ncbi:MAG: hypothetical protein LBT05_14760 [Planctomycetaceae bacterium]|jgi:hypothetical protein|nr:hypothetical protein [Planctomycetaceae bacterium]
MASFKTNNGMTFRINVTTKDAKAVRELVKYPDGTPVDLFDAAERGTLANIYYDVETLVNTVFVLCLDQIKDSFDVAEYDRENKAVYALFPEQEKEPPLTKASRWFGGLIDGDTVVGMIQAFQESVANFIPNENRRKAFLAILEREKAIEKLEAEHRNKMVNMMYDRATSHLGDRWKTLAETTARKMEKNLDGQFGRSGDTPESSESTQPTSLSAS